MLGTLKEMKEAKALREQSGGREDACAHTHTQKHAHENEKARRTELHGGPRDEHGLEAEVC